MTLSLTWLLSLHALVPLANDPPRMEYTSDGHAVLAEQHPADEGGIGGGPAWQPFGTTPNWSNTLRRQVGAVQLADMNDDGLLDLLVGCYISASCCPAYTDWRNMIYYNTGTGLEAEPSWVSADQVHTGDIQVADFNLDGFPDILSVNGGSSHSRSVIYFGSATGPDTTPDVTLFTPVTNWPTSAIAFDIDHDGDTDIITTNQTAIQNDWYRPLYLYRNNAGVIETSPSWQSNDLMISNGIDAGDYDGDGWEDLIVAKWVNFQAAIYRNVGGTPADLPVWTTGDDDGCRGALIGDLDGDGWNDVLFGYDPTRVYSNNAGTLTATWESAAASPSAQDIRLYDIDGDGDLDLGEQHFSTGRTHIYLNEGGVFPTTPSWTYDDTAVGTALAFGDINNDGVTDLVTAYSGTISLRAFYGIAPKADCPADIVNSGSSANVVDIDDLLAVISAWGPCPAPPAACPANIVTAGASATNVDIDDLLAVISAWGACP